MRDLIDHSDVLDRLSGVPGASDLRVVILADRIVDAELDVTVFAPGSLEPMAAEILKRLHTHGATSLTELATLLTPGGNESCRVIAEIVSVLERATDLTTERTVGGEVVVKPPAFLRRSLEIKMDFQLQRVHFLPPARRIDLKIQGRRLSDWRAQIKKHSDIEICEMEWPDLYQPSALSSAIASSYVATYRSRFRPTDGVAEFRHETLQRSQLLPTRERVQAAVRHTKLHKHVALHRCYIYPVTKSRTANWKTIVRRYPGGGEVFAYTQSLARACEDKLFFEALFDSSRPVS